MTSEEARKLEEILQHLVFKKVVELKTSTHFMVHAVEASFAEGSSLEFDVYVTLNPLHGIVENMNPELIREVVYSKFEDEYTLVC